jgi:hypothetical protein
MYRQQLVGTLIPDLIVDGSVIVDTQVLRCYSLVPSHYSGYESKTSFRTLWF